MMHPITGRASNECFVEFSTREGASAALSSLSKRVQILKGRHVLLYESTQAQLVHAIFPDWDGTVTENGIFIQGVYCN